MTPSSSGVPSLERRIAVGVVVAVMAAYAAIHRPNPGNAADFTWFWRAGHAVSHGISPYAAIDSTGPYPYNAGFYYTMPAAVVSIPFSVGTPTRMLPWFAAVAAFVLSLALAKDGWWRLPLLLSYPMLFAIRNGQWSPLSTASALVPTLGVLAVGKPTMAFASFAYRPTWRFAASGGAALLLSVAIWPHWPVEYLREAQSVNPQKYHIPLLLVPGFLLPLALLRWRRPEARLLAVMSCIPQTMLYYDQLALGLIARSFAQAVAFALVSYLPILLVAIISPRIDSFAAYARFLGTLMVWVYYVPCLLIVLRRPNVDPAPEAASVGVHVRKEVLRVRKA